MPLQYILPLMELLGHNLAYFSQTVKFITNLQEIGSVYMSQK